jgi:hypothetical protein
MAKAKKPASDDDDLLAEAREAFGRCEDAERDNRQTALDDIRFARAGEQWPEDILKQRQTEGRPALTINRLPTYIRQVVNDARQNKPSIKVHPADSGADPETAEVINGLIRNIEYSSNADTAYDTATECAVTGGFGYWRVSMDYSYEDSFDMDLCIKRVSNPFSVYGDPNGREADSSDWDVAFVTDRLSKAQYELEYADAEKVDWEDTSWTELGETWVSDDDVMVCEWWTREKVDKEVLLLSDGRVVDPKSLEQPEFQIALQSGMLQVVKQRTTKSCKVTQRIMSGAEVLKTTEWPGKFIPIIPVYGEEFDIEGKRYLRGLIHNAIDPQRMLNYWRTAATELVALAPRTPYIGPKGAFKTDTARWNTANTKSHAYLEYDGATPPQRQPLDSGKAAGALQEALNASDDIKATTGLFDASMGARSNETSGRAIMAREREGDVSTFHFMDNMARAIRHTGRILIDLIPKVYTGARAVRIIGEDGEQKAVKLNAPQQEQDPKTGEVFMRLHDLAAGKYDLTVKTGPSFTTRREEAAFQMTEMIRAFPPSAPIIGPELAKNLDWPGADKIAEKLEAVTSGQLPPEVMKKIEEGKAQLQKLTQENQQLKMDQSAEKAQFQMEAQSSAAKLKMEQQANQAKLNMEREKIVAELRAQEEIERLKIESAERLAIIKIEADTKIKAMTAHAQAHNQAEANKMKVQANGKSG